MFFLKAVYKVVKMQYTSVVFQYFLRNRFMDKLNEVRVFLENKIKEKGLSLNALSLQVGKNSTYLFHFIKRKSPKRLDENTRRKLAKILSVDEQCLCDFPLPSSLIQDKLSTLTSIFNFSKQSNEQMYAIDVVDMGGENKGKFEHIKKNIIGREIFSDNLLNLHCSAKPEFLKIFKVVGDAMSPTINQDDFVWVDLSYSIPSSDGIYMISTNTDTIIRRIQVNPFDNSAYISADNPSYKSINVKAPKNLNICGKICCIVHRM